MPSGDQLLYEALLELWEAAGINQNKNSSK